MELRRVRHDLVTEHAHSWCIVYKYNKLQKKKIELNSSLNEAEEISKLWGSGI